MSLIVPLLFFYNDGFGIKYPKKVDMLLNKETNQSVVWWQKCWIMILK